MNDLARVVSFAVEHPWNLTPGMLAIVAEVLARRLADETVNRADIEAALLQRKDLPQARTGNVAVIPVYGVLAPRMNLFSEMSGGTSYQQLTQQIREAAGNPKIATIVLDVDSPGGSVAGNAELAAEIMKARTKKPIIAQAEYTMASAAYQLAAAATEIVAAPSARVGSIGTYSIHDDLSSALARRGVTRTFISAGEGKVDGNEFGPLSDGARTRMQKAVDDAFGTFVGTVVHGRGGDVTRDRVTQDWKAHVYSAADALQIGMIDRIATLDETLTRLRADAPGTVPAPTYRDTPQTAPAGRSGQDRAAELALQRAALEMLLT